VPQRIHHRLLEITLLNPRAARLQAGAIQRNQSIYGNHTGLLRVRMLWPRSLGYGSQRTGRHNIVVRKCEAGLCFLERHTKWGPGDRNGINNLRCLQKPNGVCCREWLQEISGEDDEEVVWSNEYNKLDTSECHNVICAAESINVLNL